MYIQTDLPIVCALYFMVAGLSIFSIVAVLHYLQVVLFLLNLNNFHEYFIQHSLKSGGIKDHLSRVKVPGTAPY